MKKHLISLISLILSFCATALAQEVNKLSIGDISCMKSVSVDMPFYLENTNPNIVAVQFQVTVPQDVSINTRSESAKMDYTRAANHQIRISSLGSHTYNVMVLSPNNTPFRANKGKIFSLETAVASGAALTEGETYPISISNVVISDSLGNNVMTAYNNGSITLEPCPDFTVSNIAITSGDVMPDGTMSLSWTINNIGSRDSQGGWREVINFISDVTGESLNITTMHYTAPLASGQQVNRTADIAVPRVPGFDGNFHVQIMVVPNSDSGESMEYQTNNTSLSADSYRMLKRLYLTLSYSGDDLVEPEGTMNNYCYLERSGFRTADETFTLTKTAGDSRVSAPASVTIPGYNSMQYFYMEVVGDDQLNGDTVTVSYRADAAHGYEAVTASCNLIDDDMPSLTLTPSQINLTEPQEFTLTITSSHATTRDLKIQLSSEQASRFQMPAKVIMPKGETTITVNAQVIDDEMVQLPEEDVQISATAYRYNPGNTIVMLHDDDMPELTMTLDKTKVYEGDGRHAIYCTIKRLTKLDKKVNIRLSDSGDKDLYYSQTITMKKGQQEATIPIGVLDDDLSRGTREVTFTAAIYVSSCGCTIGAAAGGTMSETITIYDNDTPHFTLSTENGNMFEGQETEFTLGLTAASNGFNLPVSITCDIPEDVEIPDNVVMPAGQTKTTFKVKLKLNGTSNDSRRLTFTAKCASEASPFNTWGIGQITVMATDQTLPDLVITGMRVVTDNPTMGDSIIVETTIRNNGYSMIEAGVPITFVCEDNNQLRFTERDVMVLGQITQLDTLATVSVAGQHLLKAIINESGAVSEIDYLNNDYTTDLVLNPYFRATEVHTDQTRYNNRQSVSIWGSVAGSHPYNADVDVYIISDNNRYVVKTKTTADGHFSVSWKPEGNLAGHFIVGACTPAEQLTTEMTVFEMYGMRRYDSGFILKEFEVGECVDGYVDIINHGTLKLTDIRPTVNNMPGTATLTLDGVRTLKAGNHARVYFHLTGVKPSEGGDWETFVIRMESEEGARLEQKVYYYVYSATPVLKADVSDINTTMIKGKTREFPITLRNEGRAETGEIQVDLGNFDWLRSATPTKLPSLKQGEEATIVLLLTPTPSMSLNSITTGQLAITSANNSNITLPLYIETVSEETGLMVIDVVDEFTLNTEEAPHVEGATVSVMHPVTRKLLRQDVTNSNGLVTFALMPEGKYLVQVTHPRHSSWEQTVMVHPDRTIHQRAFISYSAITVEMHYEQTEIEDEYDIVTNVTYETNVPKAVVKLDMPEKIILEEIETPYMFYAYLTNVGLITAFDCTLQIPNEVNGYCFTPLIEGPWDILPQQTITVPVVITEASDAEEENDSRWTGPMYLPKRGQAYSAQGPRRIGASIACGMGALARFFNRCEGIGDIESDVAAHMQLTKTCGDTGGLGDFLSSLGSPGSPSASGKETPGGGVSGTGGVTQTGTDAVACDPELMDNSKKLLWNLTTSLPVIGYTLGWGTAINDVVENNDWWGVVGNLVNEIIPVLSASDHNDLGFFVDWYAGIANNINTFFPDWADDMWAHLGRRKASGMVETSGEGSIYYHVEPGFIWTAENGEEKKGQYKDLMEYVSLQMTRNWRVLARGLERTNQTEALDAPLYFSDRHFSNPQPEVGNVEHADWMSSPMRAWSDNTVAPLYGYYHTLILLHEVFGEWGFMVMTKNEYKALADSLKHYVDNPEIPLDRHARSHIMDAFSESIGSRQFINVPSDYPGFDAPPAHYITDRFINTLRLERGETLPEGETNYIHMDVVEGCGKRLKQMLKIVNRAGYESEGEMLLDENQKLLDYLQRPRASICSSVKLQIEQKLTMTRQAVRGTLTVKNGSEYELMRDVKLRLRVTDAYGNVADSHIMEIATESMTGFTGNLDFNSGWTLAAGETGIAKILFIPTRYAAPEEPMQYTFAGTISFIDPFTGLEMTRDLEVERLTVNPSPVLDLTYFLQRDIFGDDAMTSDVVETIVPSQFTLLINNKGKGDATKVRMLTNQPQIVDNEKGLLVDFEIESSQLNGGDKTMAMGQSVATDFGTIKAGTSTLAQWWLTSSLTGHFTKYDVQATHVTSYDNPDLSLLDQVSIHEMIHQITLPGVDGTTDGTTSPANIGFLVNDEYDYHDYPDQLYKTDGTTAAVSEAAGATWTKLNDTRYQLKVTTKAAGWVYGNISDPTGGTHTVKTVQRQNDNAFLPVTNFWQTDRTLVDAMEPIYENLVHFADEMPLSGETYIVEFEPKPIDPLEVTEFSGVPSDAAYTREAVGEVTIAFNRPINESTFTNADLRLMRAGETLDVSGLTIVKVNEQAFKVNLSSLTDMDGYYQLTVQTADITDMDGINGTGGKQIGWTQIEDGKANLTMIVEPEDAGTVTPGTSRQDFFGTVALTATPNTGYKFSGWKEAGKLLSEESSYTYTMMGQKTVKAVFMPLRFPVLVKWNANRGTVTGGGDGMFDYNSEVTLKAEPKNGCYFVGWKKTDSNIIISEEPELTFIVKSVGNEYEAVFKLMETVSVMLSEDADDNTSAFATPHGKFFMVSSDRQLKSWQWNPVCFPFDISEQEINKMWGYATMIIRLKSAENDVLNFEYQFDIKAGVPYLMKPERTVTTPNWEINGDNIVVAPQPITDEYNGYQFIGNYTSHTWNINRDDNRVEYYYGVGSGKIIKAKANTAALKGLRAYFVLPSGANARISIGEEVTGIEEKELLEEIMAPVHIYNMQGQYLGSKPESLPHGLYIINGKKQIIK